MSQLRLRTLIACDKTIVTTRGQIDLSTSAQLSSCLMAYVAQGCRRLVLNLSHTTYIDSSGLAVLSRVHKTMRGTNAQLVLVGCQPTVVRLLHIVGFHHLFSIEETQPRRLRHAIV